MNNFVTCLDIKEEETKTFDSLLSKKFDALDIENVTMSLEKASISTIASLSHYERPCFLHSLIK